LAKSTSGWDSPPDEIAIPLSGEPEVIREDFIQPSLLIGIALLVGWK
jgi:hypothetical protein